MITLSISKEASPIIIFTHLKRTKVVVSGIDSKSLIDSWKVCPVVTRNNFLFSTVWTCQCWMLSIKSGRKIHPNRVTGKYRCDEEIR